MKKLLLISLLFIAILTACTESTDQKEAQANDTFTYQSETGPIEVPTNPERVLILSGYTGNVIHLGVNVIGVDTWSKNNPTFAEELSDVEEVSEENLEQIIALDPDLIIALSTVNNVERLQEIAPTVLYTWGAVDYLTQHIEIGKLLNKEQEATEWVEDFQARAKAIGDDIKAEIGESSTVSVLEAFDKTVYVYGDNWARGTEILYQTMELAMPEKVTEDVLEAGYFALSTEVIPDYVGDYLVLSKYQGADTSFEETETFKNMPAVMNDRVIYMDGEGASFTDPVTLESQLTFFKQAFLNQ